MSITPNWDAWNALFPEEQARRLAARLRKDGRDVSVTAFLAVTALAFMSGAAVCAVVMFLVLRRRLAQVGARQPVQALPAHACRVSPDAVPAPARRELPAPAPQVVINLGDTLAGLLREQAAPAALAIPPAGQENHHG